MGELILLTLGTGLLIALLFIIILAWLRSVESRLDELERSLIIEVHEWREVGAAWQEFALDCFGVDTPEEARRLAR